MSSDEGDQLESPVLERRLSRRSSFSSSENEQLDRDPDMFPGGEQGSRSLAGQRSNSSESRTGPDGPPSKRRRMSGDSFFSSSDEELGAGSPMATSTQVPRSQEQTEGERSPSRRDEESEEDMMETDAVGHIPPVKRKSRSNPLPPPKKTTRKRNTSRKSSKPTMGTVEEATETGKTSGDLHSSSDELSNASNSDYEMSGNMSDAASEAVATGETAGGVDDSESVISSDDVLEGKEREVRCKTKFKKKHTNKMGRRYTQAPKAKWLPLSKLLHLPSALKVRSINLCTHFPPRG